MTRQTLEGEGAQRTLRGVNWWNAFGAGSRRVGNARGNFTTD